MNELQLKQIKKAKEYAESKGGKCLSTEYINSSSRLTWKCDKGHQWESSYNLINKGTWCPECGKVSISIKNKDKEGLIKSQEYAISKSGKCLSTEYINSNIKMIWECDKGHQWESSYHSVVRHNSWCPECAKFKRMIKNGLIKAKEYAQSKNGECLSAEYINASSKLIWKCNNPNHKSWEKSLSSILSAKSWCRECAYDSLFLKTGNKNGLAIVKEYAESKGGKCLSTEYINSSSKLIWECHKGHQWKTNYRTIINGKRWCSKCYRESLILSNGLENAKQYAISKGGLCLSTEYLNMHDKLAWICDKNHQWQSTYNSIVKQKHWCPQCNKDNRNLFDGLKKAKDYAYSRNGECLSLKYVKLTDPLEWKCSIKEHKSWFSSYANIVKGKRWCPECGANKNTQEFKVRNILNYLFDTEFIKTQKLDWNINPKTNRKLELDGYSKNLNIAFEFQGMQHFQKLYKKSNLEEIQYRDKIKKENCINNNVKLIIIHELPKQQNKDFDLFFKEILNGIALAGIKINKTIDLKELKLIFDKIQTTTQKMDLFNKAQNHAKLKNGKFLSTHYTTSNQKLEWKCHNPNHKSWYATFNKIIDSDRWCPECGQESIRLAKLNHSALNIAQEYAKNKGGLCLSTEYLNCHSKLEWKCHNPNHKSWYAPYSNVISKTSWCPECGKEKRRLSKMNNSLIKSQEYAESKGGKCLSTEYLNIKQKLIWECKKGHQWESYCNIVNKGTWCPQCGSKKSNLHVE